MTSAGSAVAGAPEVAHASDVPDPAALVRPVAVALATAELLSRRPAAPGALHILQLPASGAGGAGPSPEALFLLASERNRVGAVATFPSDTDDATALRTVVARLAMSASSRGHPRGDA